MASHRCLDRPSARIASPIFLRPFCPQPGGLSDVADGAPGGGPQEGGNEEEGLDSTGGEELEGGRGLPFRLHPGPGEGSHPPSKQKVMIR